VEGRGLRDNSNGVSEFNDPATVLAFLELRVDVLVHLDDGSTCFNERAILRMDRRGLFEKGTEQELVTRDALDGEDHQIKETELFLLCVGSHVGWGSHGLCLTSDKSSWLFWTRRVDGEGLRRR
jgi:hypothetical protein